MIVLYGPEAIFWGIEAGKYTRKLLGFDKVASSNSSDQYQSLEL